jgi:hypothetical protein
MLRYEVDMLLLPEIFRRDLAFRTSLHTENADCCSVYECGG